MAFTEEEWAERVARHETLKREMAETQARIATIKGEGVGEILGLAGDPELLASAEREIKARGLDTTPAKLLRKTLDEHRARWEKQFETNDDNAGTLRASNAALQAFQAKMNGGSNA